MPGRLEEIETMLTPALGSALLRRSPELVYTVNALLERGLIEVCGKLEAPGRPNLYRTTERFLRAAGISDVEQLPPLPEQEPQETAQTPDAVQAEPEAALPEDGGGFPIGRM